MGFRACPAPAVFFTYEVTGLGPSTQYHFRVTTRDPFGMVGTATGTAVTRP